MNSFIRYLFSSLIVASSTIGYCQEEKGDYSRYNTYKADFGYSPFIGGNVWFFSASASRSIHRNGHFGLNITKSFNTFSYEVFNEVRLDYDDPLIGNGNGVNYNPGSNDAHTLTGEIGKFMLSAYYLHSFKLFKKYTDEKLRLEVSLGLGVNQSKYSNTMVRVESDWMPVIDGYWEPNSITNEFIDDNSHWGMGIYANYELKYFFTDELAAHIGMKGIITFNQSPYRYFNLGLSYNLFDE